MKRNAVTIAFLLIASAGALAQVTGDSVSAPEPEIVCKIETSDGNTYVGTVVSDTLGVVTIDATGYGVVTIKRSLVESMKCGEASAIFGPAYNPQAATQYFISSTGHGLKAGEGYYQNTWIFFNQFSVGLTDNISLTAGIVPLFLFVGAETPIWITPRVSIPIGESFSVGAGMTVGVVLGQQSATFGIAQGVATLGDRNNNISAGIGYAMGNGEFSSTPLISISGKLKISRKTWIMTENYIVSGSALASLGFRTVFEDIGLDYGLFMPITSSPTIAPWLGLSVPF